MDVKNPIILIKYLHFVDFPLSNFMFTLRSLAHITEDSIAVGVGYFKIFLVGSDAILSVVVAVRLSLRPVQEIRWTSVQPFVSCCSKH